MHEVTADHEWLLTDGVGGYASGTASGYNTRRYHGLWVAATQPPLGRMVILSQLEIHLITLSENVYFSAPSYAGMKRPADCLDAESFEPFPFPTWHFAAGGVELTVEAFLCRDGSGVILTYDVKTEQKEWRLDIRPLLALRSFHHLRHEQDNCHAELAGAGGFHVVSAQAGHTAAAPGVYIWCDTGQARLQTKWYRDVHYPKEEQRGFDHSEDLFVPGVFGVSGSGPARFHIFASQSHSAEVDVEAQRQAEVERQEKMLHDAAIKPAGNPETASCIRRLVTAADAFLVRRDIQEGPSTTVIAGYHWFGDWGRDAMISLPGLTLATGRHEEAREVFRTFASAVNRGMIPNCFREDSGEPQYNSVDASLWFIQAAWAYLEATGDTEFLRKHLWPAVTEIVEAYANGTRFGIGAAADGLISAGDESTQLTWMDAKSNGKVVTPRHGKAVEINALWHNALCIAQELGAKLGLAPPAACSMAEAVRGAFEKTFWNDAKGCLYDCIAPDGTADEAVRPNQILAVSLPFAPLAGAKAAAVVKVVHEKLYTPFGLRTLAPDEVGYRGRYEGKPAERDAAYHQGTAWAWLLGPFIEAYLKVGGFSDKLKGEAQQMLAAAMENLWESGMGFINEIFDAEPPHAPRGCIAQAWSVAELLRVYKLIPSGS